jgi:hypothetical protein
VCCKKGTALSIWRLGEVNRQTVTYRASATYIPQASPCGESTMSKLFVMKIPAADPLINKPRGERYGGNESGREDKRGKMERGKRKGEDGTKRR